MHRRARIVPTWTPRRIYRGASSPTRSACGSVVGSLIVGDLAPRSCVTVPSTTIWLLGHVERGCARADFIFRPCRTSRRIIPLDRLKNANPRRELGTQFPIRDPDYVRRDGALAVHELVDPARRDVDVRRELTGADAHGLHEIFEQDLARMSFLELLRHVQHS